MNCSKCDHIMVEVKDFYTPRSERERKKLAKRFNFLKQEGREYSKKEVNIEDILSHEPLYTSTLNYHILELEYKIRRLKRAQDIVKKFNSKERKTDIKLRIVHDWNTDRYNLRFGHKDKTTLREVIV